MQGFHDCAAHSVRTRKGRSNILSLRKWRSAMDNNDSLKAQSNLTSGNLDEQALYFHRYPRPGKLEVQATKPLGNQRDLALAYSPGVAAPCLAIRDDPETAADYTSRANLVAVISNGT